MKLRWILFRRIIDNSLSFCYYILFSICPPSFLKTAEQRLCIFCHKFWSIPMGMFWTVEIFLCFNWVKLVHLVLWTFCFTYPHKNVKRSKVRKRDVQLMGPPLPVQEFGNSLSNNSLSARLYWVEAPFRWEIILERECGNSGRKSVQ